MYALLSASLLFCDLCIPESQVPEPLLQTNFCLWGMERMLDIHGRVTSGSSLGGGSTYD